MKKNNISDAVIRRLPRYYRFLNDLYTKGVVRISSNSLGQRMDITSSQIRQDLSCFGEFGQQGYGYNVSELRNEIGHLLGVDKGHRLIIVGCGHLGHALMQNFNFDAAGFFIDAAFDVNPSLIGTNLNGIKVRDMSELKSYIEEYKPDVAVLTIPQNVAQGVTNTLMNYGIKGFWNFTNIELKSEDKDICFENVHFMDTLMTLSYHITDHSND